MMSAILGGSIIGAIIVVIILIPLLIWTFLIFPNVDGMMQDLDWYKYDDMSSHYIFWTGFWLLIVGSGGGIIGLLSKK